eukprot:RCo020221
MALDADLTPSAEVAQPASSRATKPLRVSVPICQNRLVVLEGAGKKSFTGNTGYSTLLLHFFLHLFFLHRMFDLAEGLGKRGGPGDGEPPFFGTFSRATCG